jgi:hypothetical protein
MMAPEDYPTIVLTRCRRCADRQHVWVEEPEPTEFGDVVRRHCRCCECTTCEVWLRNPRWTQRHRY